MLTRRAFLQRTVATAGALYLLGSWDVRASATAEWSDDGYWAFADRMFACLDGTWSDYRSGYVPGSAGQTSINACLLTTHAAAALVGHVGACRQDERARTLVRRLCASPPWRTDEADPAGGCPSAQPTARAAGDQTHACGWGSSLNTTTRQHVVIDTGVVRALAQAYAAREALQLPDASVALIRDRIAKVSNSTFYAYPALRLNQINWPVEIYAHAVAVLGSDHLLRHDCRLQLARFADALTRPAAGMRLPNTGPGYRFHYLPQMSAKTPINVDSAEYATIVCGALLFYGQARTAGMAELTPAELVHVRAWVERVLCGYWTHAGYLNWDTGLSFGRWHQIKKPPLGQLSLLGIALSPEFQPSPAYGRWARYLFDRGLELYDRLVTEQSGPPPQVMFGVTRTSHAESDASLALARMAENAARASVLGLSRIPSEAPPPLYAYDPDVGRLAVTTPAYNTAVMTVNQGAFPYGGVELARLFDGDQRVAANIGGRSPACFGVVVRNRRTGNETITQRGRLEPDLDDPPLRLVRAPRGAVAHPSAYPRHAYAGPFDVLEAVGTTKGADVHVRTGHRFTAGYVETTWRITPRRGAVGPHDVEVTFPSTGADAVVTAVMQNGRSVPLTTARHINLADVAWLHVGGSESGYVVVLRDIGPHGEIRVRRPTPQSTAPRPGPTAVIRLLDAQALRTLSATVRIAPARTLEAAFGVAAALS